MELKDQFESIVDSYRRSRKNFLSKPVVQKLLKEKDQLHQFDSSDQCDTINPVDDAGQRVQDNARSQDENRDPPSISHRISSTVGTVGKSWRADRKVTSVPASQQQVFAKPHESLNKLYFSIQTQTTCTNVLELD